ncbi:MAG: hypothetical protein ABGY24_13430 [bacterium]
MLGCLIGRQALAGVGKRHVARSSGRQVVGSPGGQVAVLSGPWDIDRCLGWSYMRAVAGPLLPFNPAAGGTGVHPAPALPVERRRAQGEDWATPLCAPFRRCKSGQSMPRALRYFF